MPRQSVRAILALAGLAGFTGAAPVGQAAEAIPAPASQTAGDEFGGKPDQGQSAVDSYLNAQARDAQLADPTARDSLRTHGNP